jgi:hypothetical protein
MPGFVPGIHDNFRGWPGQAGHDERKCRSMLVGYGT